ncbi:hypothetical protein E6W39_08485 [Kitasatospora acidiphila]|uniref:ESX-1 secretion-associated protein EspA/EspE-like domain-containing protein n=1 Tax=Kitasatospora acidiphila TaxID=2567942 RepID=A0A540VZV4_9ACTN|nr:hypothetical protein [Kitasatospora acidiphila]TQF02306.1 hypothetical protein E6W39_08485 [Kitasatospora acidiphila]
MRYLSDLQQADPAAWKRVADGWLAAVNMTTTAVDDLHAQGVGPLSSFWIDPVGQAATQKVKDQANALDAAADIMRSVVMVLDGFAHSLEYAQATLNQALSMAAEYQLQVDLVQGCVQVSDVSPTVGNPPQVNQINELLREAFREADQADRQVAAELDKLTCDTGVVDPGQALDSIQGTPRRWSSPPTRATSPTARTPTWWPNGGRA